MEGYEEEVFSWQLAVGSFCRYSRPQDVPTGKFLLSPLHFDWTGYSDDDGMDFDDFVQLMDFMSGSSGSVSYDLHDRHDLLT